MFVAMNRFKVRLGEEAAFETVWRGRRSRLEEMEGFRSFHLLRGASAEDHTLYASHSIWRSKADFLAWTRSEQFRDAHRDAGAHKPLYLGPPVFEGFEAVLAEGAVPPADRVVEDVLPAEHPRLPAL
jgi:heme-degrading monooxygenase HmoA